MWRVQTSMRYRADRSVPLLVTTSIIAPLLRPYSGMKFVAMTRNSSVASGLRAANPLGMPGTEVSLLSEPSSRKLLSRSRAPFTEKPPRLVLRLRRPRRKQDQGVRIARNQRQLLRVFLRSRRSGC